MYEFIFNLFFTLTEETKYSFHSLFYLIAKTEISKDSLKIFPHNRSQVFFLYWNFTCNLNLVNKPIDIFILIFWWAIHGIHMSSSTRFCIFQHAKNIPCTKFIYFCSFQYLMLIIPSNVYDKSSLQGTKYTRLIDIIKPLIHVQLYLFIKKHW